MAEYLYIHIPFCIRKCIYCDFLSVDYNDAMARDYIKALCFELSIKKTLAEELKSIYIGGGTPSIIPEKSLGELFRCLTDNFAISSEAEITMEANPGAISRNKADSLLSFGINRLSVGVQSFEDIELKTLGRVHTSEEAMKAVRIIREAGFKNLSIDLIYGIPGQTIKTLSESLTKTAELSPEHISAYELTPAEGTPLFGLLESGSMSMPDEDLILEMHDHAIDHFGLHGYEHYEISNFSLPGFKCQHNMNYWDRGEYIGAGAGAHSFICNRRSKNTGDIQLYIENLEKMVIPESESAVMTSEEAFRELIFLGLRKTEGISLSECKELGLSISEACRELTDNGYMETTGDHIRLTGKGLKISNTVVVSIFEKLGF